MLLRRFIGCLTLCMVFVLSSTYAQATLHVGDWQMTSQVQVDKADLPPCHHDIDDAASNDKSGGHHGGCCSSFACCLGLVAEYTMDGFTHSAPPHDFGYGTILRSTSPEPLSPPPKTT
jgi:hypothetical protein